VGVKTTKMVIENYQFGSITIDGEVHQSDVIIYPDKIDAKWWRKEGHSLVPEDIVEVIKRKPAVLIVGCGATGCLKISEETAEYIKDKGIKLIAQNTAEAVQTYNQFAKKNQRVIAALHLTC